MKKTLAVTAALVLAPMVASAQTPGFYVGVGGGLNTVHISHVSDEKLGYNLTGVIGYDFVGPMVEFEGAWRHNKVSSVNLNQYTGMVNALYEFNPAARWAFHVGVGIGINDASASKNNVSVSDTNFAAQALIGMRVQLGDGFFFRSDLKFMNVFGSGSDAQNFGGTLMLGKKF